MGALRRASEPLMAGNTVTLGRRKKRAACWAVGPAVAGFRAMTWAALMRSAAGVVASAI